MSMVKIDNRESAHVRSRVKDLSKVPNVVSYTGLFACITPLAKVKDTPWDENDTIGVYDPILIRDTDSLIANFGDPRVDPEKYIDLYTVMQIVGNGTSCYVSKVDSGDTGTYLINFVNNSSEEALTSNIKEIQTYTVGTDDTSSFTITFSNALSGKTPKVFKASNGGVIEEDAINVNGNAVTVSGTFAENDTYIGVVLQDSLNCEKILYAGNDSATKNISFLYDGTPDLADVKYSLIDLDSKIEIASEYTVTYVNGANHIDLVSTEDIEHPCALIISSPVDSSTPVAPTDGASDTRDYASLIGYSSLDTDLFFKAKITQAKPLSIKAFYLVFELYTSSAVDAKPIASARVKLEKTTTNKALVNTINAAVGTYLQLELDDTNHADACMITSDFESSIVYNLFKTHELIKFDSDNKWNGTFNNLGGEDLKPYESLDGSCFKELSKPTFNVSLDAYIAAQKQFNDHKYTGCIMADLTMPLHHKVGDELLLTPATPEERRTMHFHLKDIARQRKDVNVLLSTPYYDNETSVTNDNPMSFNDVCYWVSSNDSFSELYQYGSTNTVDYGEQSFYLEMYYSWLEMTCTHLENGVAKSKQVKVAPAGPVANNVLTSYRERGIHLPVAGDQGGELSSIYTVINNPKTKAERDQLVSYRINPIWDTGTRGVQIYGNETLNAGYTDLNAAHIARALVNIRSRVDEYTETLKFSLNNAMLWDKWKNYVSMYILEPFKNAGALAKYSVAMGLDTTTPEEIANRMIKGKVSLTFYQSAEIFDLEFTVFSSATAFE